MVPRFPFGKMGDFFTPPVTYGDSPLKEGAFWLSGAQRLPLVARRAGRSKKSPPQQERGFSFYRYQQPLRGHGKSSSAKLCIAPGRSPDLT